MKLASLLRVMDVMDNQKVIVNNNEGDTLYEFDIENKPVFVKSLDVIDVWYNDSFNAFIIKVK